MSTDSTPDGTAKPGDTATGGPAPAPPPVAPDRPVVDGATMSVEELEAQIAAETEALGDERRQEVDALRAEVGDTAAELADRFDVAARARARKDETVAAVRARAGWLGPAAVAAVTVLVVLLARRRSARGGGRSRG
jgi:hypothetical protein